jgi:tRNA (guanine37-N1)-methyltransferase
MLTITVVTIFPEFFTGPLALSIPARAAQAGLVQYRVADLREWTHDRHRTVDDAPFGGGAGMVLKPAPFFEAVEALGAGPPIVLLSPRGRPFAHADAVRFAAGPELTLLCGHYKDVDQRVADHLATEELSLGDFVLSGGEPAALAIVDAVVRLLPGALGDRESAETDSFYDRGISAPSYTRPAEYRGHAVPEVLLSGDHAKVAAWREAESLRRTRAREAADRDAFEAREAAIAEREARIAQAEADVAARAAKRARRKGARPSAE